MRIDSFNVIPKFTNIYSSFYCKKRKLLILKENQKAILVKKILENFMKLNI